MQGVEFVGAIYVSCSGKGSAKRETVDGRTRKRVPIVPPEEETVKGEVGKPTTYYTVSRATLILIWLRW
jgi:hypothetical protein